MKCIAYSAADLYVELSEESVTTIVVENQNIFVKLISDISDQIEGRDGIFVLSNDYTPLDMHKHAEIITQLIPFTVNHKELLNKVYSEIKKKAVSAEHYIRTQEIMTEIEKYIFSLLSEYSGTLQSAKPDDITALLKMFDVHFDDADMSLSEKILEYCISVNEYKGERVFFIVNMRNYIDDDTAEELFYNFLLNKIDVIFIESSERKKLKNEKRVIIDSDLCAI